MKKYLFNNAHGKLEEIDNKLENQDIQLSKFSRKVLALIVIIYLINMLLIRWNSSYVSSIYELMQDNYITSKLLELSLVVTSRLFDSKEMIVHLVSAWIFILLVVPFLIEGYINKNKKDSKTNQGKQL